MWVFVPVHTDTDTFYTHAYFYTHTLHKPFIDTNITFILQYFYVPQRLLWLALPCKKLLRNSYGWILCFWLTAP